MIIRFDRTPEEYHRLSQSAFSRGELDRALLYAEDALRGRSCTEYKVSYAAILLAMGRYGEASDVVLEALCYGTGMRAELYGLMGKISSELGHFYESLHFWAKKAHYEGDDDTLTAMDEVMEEIDAEREARREERDFFIVGKEEKREDPENLLRANYAFDHGDYAETIRLAAAEPQDSPRYVEAQVLALRSHLRRKEPTEAERVGEEILRVDPHNAYAIYIMIDRFNRREYAPLLSDLKEVECDIYYAVLAADSLWDRELADHFVERLMRANPYVPGAYFVAAAVALNFKDREKSERYLSDLSALYRKYPREVLLRGWRRLKHCRVGFSGKMPPEVAHILENYVTRHARNARDFTTSMLTDAAFRSSVLFLMEDVGRKINTRIISYLEEVDNRQVDAFFSKALIRYDMDLLLKRDIFATLYYRKDKGLLYLTQTVVPIRVSCRKPQGYADYPTALRQAYCEIFAFLTCMTDASCEERLRTLADRIALREDAEDLSTEVICGAILYRMLAEGAIPVNAQVDGTEDACRFILEFVFGFRRYKFSKVLLLAASIKH